MKSNLYFEIGGICFQIQSDDPISDQSFDPKFRKFWLARPGEDLIQIYHHSSGFSESPEWHGRLIVSNENWKVYHNQAHWIYVHLDDETPVRVAAFNEDHSYGDVFSQTDEDFRKGNISSLTLCPPDQMLLVYLLTSRHGCLLHASGIVIDGQGLIFMGHSGAGKSTIVRMLEREGTILCDERIILRNFPDGLKIYGTWLSSDVQAVSPESAPLKGIFLLEHSDLNRIDRIEDPGKIIHEVSSYMIRGTRTKAWYENSLELLQEIICTVPVYSLKFDKSGQIIPVIRGIL